MSFFLILILEIAQSFIQGFFFESIVLDFVFELCILIIELMNYFLHVLNRVM